MDRPGSDSLFPQLAKPFDLTASLHALEDTGPGMAVWDALNNRDHAAVDLALDVFGDRAVAESMLSLGVHLLRQAGHHHVGLHDRLPGGGYDSIGTHLDDVPIGFCTDDDVPPECACSLATAVHWISGIAPTPRAHLFFAQLALQVNPVTPAPPATLEKVFNTCPF